jgi:hypothetical protein
MKYPKQIVLSQQSILSKWTETNDPKQFVLSKLTWTNYPKKIYLNELSET